MTRDEARQEIRSNWRFLLSALTSEAKQRVNGETSYVCPICGHGRNGDGLTYNPKSADSNSLKCFGCGFSGDIITLYMKTKGLSFIETIDELAAQMGIVVDVPVKNNAQVNSSGISDYSSYYVQCQKRLQQSSEAIFYLSARGISIETAIDYGIGFDPNSDPANAPGGVGEVKYPCPRIIVPTSSEHYVGRSIDVNTPKERVKMNNKGGKSGIFNERALYSPDVKEVFVTEGWADALSVIEVGENALAINSANNADSFIRKLEKKTTKALLILCLDKDEQGLKATRIIEAGLRRLNISYVIADICGQHKDPNAFLQNNRDDFIKAVKEAKIRIFQPDNTMNYIIHDMGADMKAFENPIATGFDNLDKLTGGLYAGLYCIAAVSSLGKTTFAAQLADQIAASGRHVLFFSLEQSRLELVSKSLARITAQNDIRTAVTSLNIRRGNVTPAVTKAVEQYQKLVETRVSIIEGNFNCNISFIGEYVRRYITQNGIKPIVFVDYLQILQGDMKENGRRLSVRETVDSAVTALKRISRENELTVFIISSVNRSNYMTPIDFESLKESGGIEYTCDVIWGLQLQCINGELFNSDSKAAIKKKRDKIKEAKKANPRKIELVCLKNRYGISSFSAYFKYYPANDLFTICSDNELDFE